MCKGFGVGSLDLGFLILVERDESYSRSRGGGF